MARLLIGAGVLLVLAGALLLLGVPIGRLPGDVVVRRGNTTFYFPIVTCLIVSVVMSLLAAFFRR